MNTKSICATYIDVVVVYKLCKQTSSMLSFGCILALATGEVHPGTSRHMALLKRASCCCKKTAAFIVRTAVLTINFQHVSAAPESVTESDLSQINRDACCTVCQKNLRI